MKDKHPEPTAHRVECDLGPLLQARDMTLVQLAERTGITVANLGVLKNGRARAIRYSTLTAICDALGCQPGDLLTVRIQPNKRVDDDEQTHPALLATDEKLEVDANLSARPQH